MKNERVISIGMKTKVYHKPSCRYVNRMRYKNQMSISLYEAKMQGLRPCICCNTMEHQYKIADHAIEKYQKKGMQFLYLDNALYVKSDLGCWKIMYLKEREKLRLFHGNRSNKDINFDLPQYEPYHRQTDKKYADSIEQYLHYIYEHDKYKSTVLRGEKVTQFSSKKYKKREPRAARKRAIKRVDKLFALLESQNEDYLRLSVC